MNVRRRWRFPIVVLAHRRACTLASYLELPRKEHAVFPLATVATWAAAASMPGLTAALTRSVTSSMLISTFSSRSTHLISSSRERA